VRDREAAPVRLPARRAEGLAQLFGVEEVCAELRYDWRQGELDPPTTLALFMQQIMAGNVGMPFVCWVVPPLSTPRVEPSPTDLLPKI
jgi:hypothetical protein